MINLFKLKKMQKENAEKAKKQSAGELRLYKDMGELNQLLSESFAISFPNGADDLMNFEVLIIPYEGYYVGGEFLFCFEVSPMYPHEAPKVKCKTKIIHPNIDLEGKICLNVLREDWSPVQTISTIICGLFHLFNNPNFDDPLNPDAAAVLRQRAADGYVGQRRWEP